MAFFENTLKSEVMYSGKIFRALRDEVEVQSGHTALREVVEHSGGVGVLAVDSQGRAAMVRQFRYPFRREIMEIPAGKLEPHEDPLECAVRELSEETGLTAGRIIPLGSILPSPGYCAETLYVYLALDLTAGEAHLDEDEFLDVELVPLTELHDMVMRGELTDAKTVIAILKGEIYLRESE